MTTPNIKAMAERIKQLSAKSGSLSWHEVDELTRLQGQAHVLADVLLRVMEDGDRLNRSLKIRHNPQKCMNDDELLGEHCLCCEALESHRKLMEEL